jgi:hypothetical protein
MPLSSAPLLKVTLFSERTSVGSSNSSSFAHENRQRSIPLKNKGTIVFFKSILFEVLFDKKLIINS